MSTFVQSEFAERLKKQRLKAGYIRQRDLADKAGVSPQVISYYEKGDRLPDACILARLAQNLNCSVDYLLQLEDAPTHALADLCEQTGLSEEAATTIQSVQKRASSCVPTSQSIDKQIAQNTITLLDNLIVSKSLEQIAIKYINWTSAILDHENINHFRQVRAEVPQDVHVTSRDIKFGYKYHLTMEINAFLDEMENKVIEEFKNPWLEAYNKRKYTEANDGEHK